MGPHPSQSGFSAGRALAPQGFLRNRVCWKPRLKALLLTVEKSAMSEEQESVCFTCGLTTGGTLRLNCLPSGQVCPTCRDRLLDSLPAILPAEDTHAPESIETAEYADSEFEMEHEPEKATGPQLSPRGPGQLLHGDGPNEPA
jgi:hypothetical protein